MQCAKWDIREVLESKGMSFVLPRSHCHTKHVVEVGEWCSSPQYTTVLPCHAMLLLSQCLKLFYVCRQGKMLWKCMVESKEV